MKVKGKDCKRIGADLLKKADVLEDYEEIKEDGQALAKRIIEVTGSVDHLRSVYHRLSACLTALFTELDTAGKSYEEIASDVTTDKATGAQVDWSQYRSKEEIEDGEL